MKTEECVQDIQVYIKERERERADKHWCKYYLLFSK